MAIITCGNIRRLVAAMGVGVGLLFGAVSKSEAQGCVAARGAGISCSHMGVHAGEALPPSSGFQASVGYRWLQSDRHFVGDDEQEERQEEGSEVINNSNFIDVGLTYAFSPRFSASLTIPFSIHDRSQVVRSNDVARTILQRFHTQSAGLGDLRLEADGWLLDPATPRKANVLLGVGVDMPTGQDDVQDTFQVFNAATGLILAQERTVDQSIQPGDGGWGIVADLYGYWVFLPRLSGYLSGFYVFTPEEKNGVPTYRSNPYESVMSIADSYMGRAGLEYVVWPEQGLSLSLGARVEGVPVQDAFGGSDGFRRPGYAVSVEPGISAMLGDWTLALYAPVAVYRNRLRSVPDFQFSEATGVYRHGDAAFADFSLLFSVAKRF